MKCPNCINDIPENKKFCGFCGARLERMKAEKIEKVEYLGEEKSAVECKGQEIASPLKSTIQDKLQPPVASETKEIGIEAGTKKPKKKRRLLEIILPLVFVSAVVIAVLLWIRQTNLHLASLNQQPEPTRQTIEVLAYCQDSLGSEVNYVEPINQDQDVILKYGWLAVTEEQIGAYINGSEHAVFLDDVLVSGFEMDPIAEYSGPWPEGWIEDEAGYIVQWKKNIGLLEPGSHYVTYTRMITSEIFDGFDTYLAGDEWTSGCEIIIE